jgi:glycosyltransferase involved in cell wall biosynthesis
VRGLTDLTGYLRRFRSFLTDLSPALVHSNSLFSFAEALTAKRAGHPTMLHVHDMAPAGWSARPARWIARRGVDATIAVSRACAASYAHDGWAPDVVYESAPLPDSPASIRKRPKPFVIGTVGVVAPRKGSDIFVEAGRQIAQGGSSIELRMIGAASDPLERDWGASVIEDARMAGITHLPEADVEAEMRGWDALALPSRMDPFPLVVLEAMALGIPVIGSRVDGLAEQITDDCGLLVEPESPQALAAAMLELAALPAGRRAAMGAAGRARVAAEFSASRQAEGIAEAYARAAGRRP